jgi:hypothetical protein
LKVSEINAAKIISLFEIEAFQIGRHDLLKVSEMSIAGKDQIIV